MVPSTPSPHSPAGAPGRRELVRRYKETPPPMGVYAIRHLPSGRVFLGAGLDLQAAMNRARFELGFGSHRDMQLQQDWAAGGADAFCFERVDILKRREEPGGDYKAELQALLALWREDFRASGACLYGAQEAA